MLGIGMKSCGLALPKPSGRVIKCLTTSSSWFYVDDVMWLMNDVINIHRALGRRRSTLLHVVVLSQREKKIQK